MHVRVALAAAVVAIAATSAHAGPDEIVTALTGTPATLFDLGLARLEAYVAADAVSSGYSASVRYEDREVLVHAWAMEEPGDEAAARTLLARLKVLADVDPATGTPNQPASAFASKLSFPTRIDEFAVDPAYLETLDSMFRLKVVLGVAGDGEAVVCSGKLLSTDVVCVRE
jgi:hypothetical protein